MLRTGTVPEGVVEPSGAADRLCLVARTSDILAACTIPAISTNIAASTEAKRLPGSFKRRPEIEI